MVAILHEVLAPFGLNLVGVAAVAEYEAGVPETAALRHYFPAAVSAIVIGNGGGDFWRAYTAYMRAHPDRAVGPDPLDTFTRHVVETVACPWLAADGIRPEIVYPFAAVKVSFMRLAACAGLGVPSVLGVLIHPTFGPWIALRAALLVTEQLTLPGPATGFDPCPTCTQRACVSACPAGAVSERGWDAPTCADYRGSLADPCAPMCHARFQCVIGREHRYPAEAAAHHQAHVRAALLSSRRAPR